MTAATCDGAVAMCDAHADACFCAMHLASIRRRAQCLNGDSEENIHVRSACVCDYASLLLS